MVSVGYAVLLPFSYLEATNESVCAVRRGVSQRDPPPSVAKPEILECIAHMRRPDLCSLAIFQIPHALSVTAIQDSASGVGIGRKLTELSPPSDK